MVEGEQARQGEQARHGEQGEGKFSTRGRVEKSGTKRESNKTRRIRGRVCNDRWRVQKTWRTGGEHARVGGRASREGSRAVQIWGESKKRQPCQQKGRDIRCLGRSVDARVCIFVWDNVLATAKIISGLRATSMLLLPR